ncbi:hypothetical protein V1477_013730 [Vespula maculifrons]|uniref:Uncharacterized protein n=1 Tax=Vespula maculifrons TaxID=7453 RepID=A0ABD2BQK4_VESMC
MAIQFLVRVQLNNKGQEISESNREAEGWPAGVREDRGLPWVEGFASQRTSPSESDIYLTFDRSISFPFREQTSKGSRFIETDCGITSFCLARFSGRYQTRVGDGQLSNENSNESVFDEERKEDEKEKEDNLKVVSSRL